MNIELDIEKEINKSLYNIESNEFVYNDFNERKQVLSKIVNNLNKCDEFLFSVAFITDSGLSKLKLQLHELEKRNVKGRIITTNYLNFSEPRALDFLLKFKNIEVRMVYLENSSNYGYHTKGYIFRKDDVYSALIGSSNLTASALTVNKEWNTEIIGKKDALAIDNILKEFDKMWDQAVPLKNVIDKYRDNYFVVKNKVTNIDKPQEFQIIKPNAMQKVVIERTNELINKGEKRALLISATGTGKTFASAFAIKNIEKFNVKKLLFITHRETILKQAKSTFDVVFENNISSAVFSGSNKDIKKANYIFASFSLLIKDEYLNQFDEDEFDVIIIDEVHRVGENKYQKIIQYFKPKFLLGMSATPDRTDGYDLYSLFDHNIVYEIRLMNALDSNMLTPFNYFGVTDISVDGKCLDDLSDFNSLTSNERVNNIVYNANYYGFSGNKLKGLVFVNDIETGKCLSSKFNERGYKSCFLDGSSSIKERERAIARLEENNTNKEYLDYIFTVDIFNEGVDIPSVNQIILLRPTKSSIVFIQQLGRGLRLYKNKEYVTVLDFIGNYANNYCIAEALNATKITKEEVIKSIKQILPGESVINFEPIARELIYKSIDKAKLNSKKDVFLKYIDVKNRLNRIPTLIEFDEISSTSARVFLDYQVYTSYYDFLTSKDNNYAVKFNNKQISIIRYLSKNICDGKRNIESEVLISLIFDKKVRIKDLKIDQIDDFLSLINFGYANSNERIILINKSHISKELILSDDFKNMLVDVDFKNHILMLLEYAIYNNKESFNSSNTFELNQKYSRKDVCRIINNPKNEESTIYGYKLFRKQKILPIFVNYSKVLDKDSTIIYEDQFIDKKDFIWFSRHGQYTYKGQFKEIIDRYNKNDITILLFVKKSNSKLVSDEDNSFYFLGKVKMQNYIDSTMNNGNPVVKTLLHLENPCRDDIYDYIISPIDLDNSSNLQK